MVCEHCAKNPNDLGGDWGYCFKTEYILEAHFKDNKSYVGLVSTCRECGKWNIIVKHYAYDENGEDFVDGGDWALTDEEKANLNTDKDFENFILNTEKGRCMQEAYGKVEKLDE